MQRLLWIAVTLLVFFTSCSSGKKNIARHSDYAAYLDGHWVNERADNINTEIAFWESRLQADTGSYVNMVESAKYQLQLFKTKGRIANLHKGDSLLQRCSDKVNHTSPELLYSLSQAAVTQHQFTRSAAFISGAEKANGDLYTIRLLQFDTYMELGRYPEAWKSLSTLKDKTGFDYLIRFAKWQDHKGNLPAAITLMEKALGLVKGKNEGLYFWTLSNLSDMYGHDGRVADAYKGYLEVLKKNPADLYCLKGIAWIAFSHDRNYNEARRIVQFILSQTAMPDLKLMLAEIAEQEGNTTEKNKLIQEFITEVKQPAYGNMYTKYLVQIYTEDLADYDKALQLAEQEINNRFTPETCSWLAWSYYKKGDMKKAAELSRKFVWNKTFEPEAQYRVACMEADAGNTQLARQLLESCLQSSFELGPAAEQRIREKLAML
ncbi:MAG: hypothetical protein NTW29_20180 [Bacteroidetes bacterium]|nr:hypothetical protein [Bacteroidota bacterium]